ncbi:MAG: DUF5011 domain-containing protein [Chitinivibrionales bacterium]|nr:DUF5011 domain-containing protein [Chitinivibrionales bacterium]MBD3394860.1 DUF5011 domain-containing protein [Chitinivibrionales bacterium]
MMNRTSRCAKVFVTAGVLIACLCTQVEYDNPLDTEGSNYGGDAPVITLNGDDTVYVQAGAAFIDPGASAVDDLEGDVSAGITVSGTVDTYNPGTYFLSYTAEDDAGNTKTVKRTVVVTGEGSADSGAPIIALKGLNPMSIALNASYDEPGATATDYVDGDLTDSLKTSGTVDTSKAGNYTITYKVSDKAGNKSTATRTVIVGGGTQEDLTPPVITLEGAATMQLSLGDQYVEPGATATDDVDGDLTGEILITGHVDATLTGEYTVTYTVSDFSGNEASETRTVTVTEESAGDATPPVITLAGDNPMTIVLGNSYTEPGATAVDNADGNLTAAIDISGEVNTSDTGTYTVRYTVSDAAGNTATKTRTVKVVEEQALDVTDPVITLKGDNPMTLTVDDTYTEPGATATDDVEGNLTVQIEISGTVNTSEEGSYTVTYTVSDAAGNTAERTRTVNVEDGQSQTGDTVALANSDQNTNLTVDGSQSFTIPADNGSGYTYTTGQINKGNQSLDVDVTVNGSTTTSFGTGEWGGQFSISDRGDGKVLITVSAGENTTIMLSWW